jgi:periplasmic protein TonB
MIAMAANIATSHGIDRAETARWTLCFAAVVAAHGLAALSLWSSPEASDFVAGAPVVMLELPEAPASAAIPPSDLMPGPPEAESEPTPPKEQETKPPEQVAEVALPVPEPPKPKPPTEERPPTAMPSSVTMPSVPAPPTPGAAVASQAVVKRWESALVAHIERFKRYPAEARAHDERGVARVAFTIDRDGWVRASHVVQSSGSPTLDAETLAMLDRAQPMPRPPAQLAGNELSFVVPVRFNIR